VAVALPQARARQVLGAAMPGQWCAFWTILWYNGLAGRGPLRPTDVAHLSVPCSYLECSIDATRKSRRRLAQSPRAVVHLGIPLLVEMAATVALVAGLLRLTWTYSRLGDIARTLLNLRLWLLSLMVSGFGAAANLGPY
jgi:hypothetical protein